VSTPGEQRLADEAATEAFGARLAALLAGGEVVHLQGGLGAGKTTLCRGLLRALGHRGAVKSPTYTLVETYACGARRVHHFDLYRLREPLELEDLGVRDYVDGEALLLIEWPERGAGCTPAPDLVLELREDGAARRIRWSASSPRGEAIVAALAAVDGRA
jgi:tRNA threonylcarbamoyladenosine biosynthesis protein TsaE